MKAWTPEHGALLNALSANQNVPALYRRLSLDRLSPDDAEIRRLRGWATSIRKDPGWKVIEPVIDRSSAWPAIWEDACLAGFSPETEHHHALLFGRFCEKFADHEDYQSAEWAWGQVLRSWSAVFTSKYPERLFEDLDPTLSEEGPDRDELLASMLDRLVDARTADLRAASGVATPGIGEVDRRRLRFASRAMDLPPTVQPDDEEEDRYGTLRRLVRSFAEARGSVTSELLNRFEKSVEEIDLTEAAGEELLRPFRWVGEYFGVVGISEQAATTVTSNVVETCWGLRRIDRDEIDEFSRLLEIGEPFNEDLFGRLTSFDSAFGHNSRCADFLVFQGELADDSDKREIFERGLQVCPGHRNSAMLLSYRHLHDAEVVLAKLTVALPPTRKRNARLVREADEAVRKAEEVYPYNESLPDVRERVDEAARRFGVEL